MSHFVCRTNKHTFHEKLINKNWQQYAKTDTVFRDTRKIGLALRDLGISRNMEIYSLEASHFSGTSDTNCQLPRDMQIRNILFPVSLQSKTNNAMHVITICNIYTLRTPLKYWNLLFGLPFFNVRTINLSSLTLTASGVGYDPVLRIGQKS